MGHLGDSAIRIRIILKLILHTFEVKTLLSMGLGRSAICLKTFEYQKTVKFLVMLNTCKTLKKRLRHGMKLLNILFIIIIIIIYSLPAIG